MSIPNDATHYFELKGLYYKQKKETITRVYVWSDNGYWIESRGGSLDNHEFIKPIKKD